jgi:phosphatidylserine/phosphatidylglycerophosphate/cardiolipin synthase-like enzyme
MGIAMVKRFLICMMLVFGHVFCVSAMQKQFFLADSSINVQFRTGLQTDLLADILSLFDNAQKSVLVAVSSITEDNIINKLIELQKRGIDVQIIFDETSPHAEDVFQQFLKAGIMPIVNLSNVVGRLMSTAFIVIDDEIVVTGSINLVPEAISP